MTTVNVTFRITKEKRAEFKKKLIDEGMSQQDFLENAIDDLIKKNKMNDAETKDEMIKEMAGQRAQVNAEWLEKNDQELLDWVVSSNYWGKGFSEKPARNTAFIEIQFTKEGVQYTATTTDVDNVAKSIVNQEPWGEDSWEDWSKEDVELYYNLLN